MSTTIFQTDLNDFCRKYLVINPGQPEPSPINFLIDGKKIEASIFEQLLLFDTVSFKVYGENIPIAILLNHFGVKGVEALLEQDALEFVLWNHMLTYMVDDIPGVDPLQHGSFNSKPHSDPEESLTLGFNWMKSQPKTSVKKNLIRKIRDKYSMPERSLSGQAVSLVKSAYNTGKLKPYNLTPENCDFIDLDLDGRKKLCHCADEVLQYSHLIKENMASYTKFEFYQMFNETNRKLHEALKIQQDFNRLSELENIPNLQSLYVEIEEPFKRLLKIRNKGTSKKFRAWLGICSKSSDSLHITKEYIDASANSKGFFQTKKGRFTKNIAMSAIGAGVGGMIAGPGGAIGGAGAAKFLEPIADFGLDLLDEFVLSGLAKGWTPKLFFDDVEKRIQSNKANSADTKSRAAD